MRRSCFINPTPIVKLFNVGCSLVKRASFREPLYEECPLYYGINTSPYKEPPEQFDPMLLVGFWNRLNAKTLEGLGYDGPSYSLTIFIAGKYRLLNLTQGKNPLNAYAQWERDEQKKRDAWKTAISNLGMGSSAQILVTDDLWKEPRYWQIVCEIVSRKDELPNQRQFQNIQQAAFFGDLPVEMLGGIEEMERRKLSPFRACELYLYAEMGEAYFLREKLGVRGKIGPATEEEYDQYLGDFSIIQLENPMEFTREGTEPKPLIPYIGFKGQARFWMDDQKKIGFLDRVSAILEEELDYAGGPISQWRARLALWRSSSIEDFFRNTKQLLDRERLGSEIAAYLSAIGEKSEVKP